MNLIHVVFVVVLAQTLTLTVVLIQVFLYQVIFLMTVEYAVVICSKKKMASIPMVYVIAMEHLPLIIV